MTLRTPRFILAVTVLVYVFLHLPLLVLMAFSFNDSKFSVDWQGFTLAWYQRPRTSARPSRRSGRMIESASSNRPTR